MAKKFNEDNVNRNGKAGIPGVASLFAPKTRIDGGPLLEVADAYDVATLPVNVHDDWVELTVVDHYGYQIHITTDSTKEVDRFQVWGDPIVVDFQREDDQVFTDTWLQYAATKAYDEALVERMKRMKGMNLGIDTQLNDEIEMVSNRAKGSGGLTIPDGWEGEYKLTQASLYDGERLYGGEYSTDPIGARATWAEVGADGITYGYTIPVGFIGEITVGEQAIGERDDDYAARVWAGDQVTDEQLNDFFAKEYDVQVNDHGDDGDFDLEFYVEYGPEGATGSSLEAMGDRAERETKLLDARNEWEAGGSMQSKFAAFIGYTCESVYAGRGEDREYVGARWVKDEA